MGVKLRFVYNKNGRHVKYSLEDVYSSEGEITSVAAIPAEFMPLPEYPRRGFFQTLGYRIKNMDLLGAKERRAQEAVRLAQEKKRRIAWKQKQAKEEEKRARQSILDCRPERLRATGVSKLIEKIKNAHDVAIYGFAGAINQKFYDNMRKSYIDNIAVDLQSRMVTRDGSVVMTIPETQIRAVYDALNVLRQKAINGELVR